MLKTGYGGWRTRSATLSWSGADATDGGRFTELPTNFLRAYGSQRPGRSAIVRPDGRRWGSEIEPDLDHMRGDYYYVRGDELWITRGATPPTDAVLDYHYRHPTFDDDLEDEDIDFPMEARPLIPAEAAYVAMSENWLPAGTDMQATITRARLIAREDARHVARRTKQPRTAFRPYRAGNRW
jgi:hypothetical protein